MRILYVATRIPFPLECGGTTHVRGVVRELMRRGHEVVLCAASGPGLAEGMVEGMPTYRFTWRNRDLRASQAAHRWAHGLRIARLARQHRSELVYEREHSMGAGALAARLAGLPLVVEVNDAWFHEPSLRRAARIVVHGGGTLDHIPARCRGKVVWVHAAVDAAAYEGVEPMELDGLRGRRGVCYTGSMLAWHGIPALAKALPAVLERVPEATFVVAGEATTEGGHRLIRDLEGAATSAGDAGALLRLGRVPHADIPRLLAACEVCVAPYDPTGEPDLERYGFFYSPMKLWEYMAAGRAVVSTDLPSIHEILGDDRGLLVPPGDAGALADAVVRLLTDDDLRRGMGERGLAFARENTWERRVDDYERALLEAAGAGDGDA